jgi:hypothetical protein
VCLGVQVSTSQLAKYRVRNYLPQTGGVVATSAVEVWSSRAQDTPVRTLATLAVSTSYAPLPPAPLNSRSAKRSSRLTLSVSTALTAAPKTDWKSGIKNLSVDLSTESELTSFWASYMWISIRKELEITAGFESTSCSDNVGRLMFQKGENYHHQCYHHNVSLQCYQHNRSCHCYHQICRL